MHTALVCADFNPTYYNIPGFGPIALGWGWGLLGLLAGVLLTIMTMLCKGYSKPPQYFGMHQYNMGPPPPPPGLGSMLPIPAQ
eukprot:6122893-Pyramimonas_sp.AAC.1